jgi:protein-disulfide isomerase-like protein with CxxC motif
MARKLQATLYTDPACPWGYSAIPALRVLEWRYGDQIEWRLVTIGLAEDASVYAGRGFTPLGFAVGWLSFRRYGMPFGLAPKERLAATARACRAVVAARLDRPGDEWRVLRTLQLANFTTPVLLDDDAQLQEVLAAFPGIVARLDDPDVTEAYERDRAEARTAAGTPAELQGKTAVSDGVVRYTAPSVVFERGGCTLVAGGFQPVEAYDVLVANLDPTLRREPAPASPLPLLERFRDGLTTQEVAALLARGNDAPDRRAAEEQLLALVAAGAAARQPLGDDALWLPAAVALSVAA